MSISSLSVSQSCLTTCFLPHCLPWGNVISFVIQLSSSVTVSITLGVVLAPELLLLIDFIEFVKHSRGSGSQSYTKSQMYSTGLSLHHLMSASFSFYLVCTEPL